MAITLALLALLIEAVFGYPDWLLRTIGHPVTWLGRVVEVLDRGFNREALSGSARRAAGAAAIVLIVCVAGMVGYAAEFVLFSWPLSWLLAWPLGTVALAVLASALIAQRSLYDHVRRVADALEQNDLPAAREAVSHIVGRDTGVL